MISQGQKRQFVTGKEKTDKEGEKGEFFGCVTIEGTKWAIIRWEGEDDPDLYKAHLLLIEKTIMGEIE